MSKTEFLTTYLREIGVQTPVSLLRLGAEINESLSVLEHMSLQEMAVNAAKCDRCGLSASRGKVVFGSGDEQADLVLISEAPNAAEDQQGEACVHQTGTLLNAMLATINLDRKAVYVVNIVKCSPPNQRDPKLDEVNACKSWLDAQLDMIRPKVICVLGRVAAQALLQSDASLNDLRGQWHEYRGIPVRVAYHPAYLLRSPQQKGRAWQDLQLIQECLIKQ